MRPRQQKGSGSHYLIAVNKRAAEYSDRTVHRLTGDIRSDGGFYTVIEPDSREDLLKKVREYCQAGRSERQLPPHIAKRGRITALVAAGGDGTVNAVAEAALELNLPMGILPSGRMNNIARSLCAHPDLKTAIGAIIGRKYRPLDVVKFGNRVIVGSLSLGLLPQLAKDLQGRGMPRFSFRVASMAAKAASEVERIKMVAKLDSFRFDIDAKLFSVNLLAYTLGLRLSPASVSGDGQGEIIFDVNCSDKELGGYIRDVYKGRYVYGSAVRLYRGAYITFNPGKGRMALLDGDIIQLSEAEYSLQVGAAKLKIYC